MSIIACTYFDGRVSTPHPASLILGAGGNRVVGRDVSVDIDVRRLRVSQRVANTPRWLYLPDGGACRVDDNAAIDRIVRESSLARRLHQWESRPALAALALIAVVALTGALIKFGVPLAADQIAQRIPVEAEQRLGRQALTGLDRQWMRPTRLPAARQALLNAKFAQLLAADRAAAPVRLEFRDAPAVGPNAFALPGGIIVVTDQLVRLARSDNEIAGVLAHELGHLRHRHSMRGLLESSAVALLIAAITGDIASTSSLAAAAPVTLLQSKFSRDNESEADRFAIDLMRRADIDASFFATMLGRLRDKGNGPLPTFLSSHPATTERIAMARAAAGAAAGRLAGRVAASPAQVDQAPPEELARARARAVEPALIRNPRERRVAGLVLAGDVAALEAEMGSLQAAFERDALASEELIRAAHAFSRLPGSAEGTLDAWNARYPRSHSAALARARFNFHRGMDARGSAYGADTSSSQFERMGALFERARDDARRGLELSPRPLLSHRALMVMANVEGDQGAVRAHYADAEKLAPASFETRLAYLHTLEPRWGGSLRAMREYANRSRQALAPRDAEHLSAIVLGHEADLLERDGRHAAALAKADAALGAFETAETRCLRARILSSLDRHPESFEDVRRGLALQPDEDDCLRIATHVASRAGDQPALLEVLSAVITQGRGDAETHAQRGWRHQQQKRNDAAYADYLAAAQQGHAWSQLRVSEMLYHGTGVAQDRAAARVWLEKGGIL